MEPECGNYSQPQLVATAFLGEKLVASYLHIVLIKKTNFAITKIKIRLEIVKKWPK